MFHKALQSAAGSIALSLCLLSSALAQSVATLHLVTDKARYTPREPARITLEVETPVVQSGIEACVALESRGQSLVRQCRTDLQLHAGHNRIQLDIQPPSEDFRGYRIAAQLRKQGTVLAEGASALDVSSTWARYPRYGYMAHYDAQTPVSAWIEELNRYHIDGLLFYDVQNKHHMPVPTGNALPAQWPDVAGRKIERDVVLDMLAQARHRHMTTMVYNASYAAYQNAFIDGSGVQLDWATWPSATVARTHANVKFFELPKGWSTPGLLYMNQADPRWQRYLFAQMQRLFAVLPFDGWHVDTFGDAAAWDFSGQKIDFFSSFPQFVAAAHTALRRPIVLNTVSGSGQEAMANSPAEFVYSELWPEDHATYDSILQATEAIHASNPGKAIVFAAYMQKGAAEKLTSTSQHEHFNLPGLLLTDAAIFAAGAAHIELGDGDRMLSSPYFPDDQTFTLEANDRAILRDYYDFLVANENLLRDPSTAASSSIVIDNAPASPNAKAGKIWTIARRQGNTLVAHLINLTAVQKPDWRNDAGNLTMPATQHGLQLRISESKPLTEAAWASPEIDHGAWHRLPVRRLAPDQWELTVPELRIWSMLVLQTE